MNKEPLVRIGLKDGSSLDIRRQDDDVHICHDDYCVVIPKATGKHTLDLLVLLESLGVSTEFPEEGDESTARDQ